MKLALISTQNRSEKELETILLFLENGLDYFHIKKPKFSLKKLEKYVEKIPIQYRDRIVLHNHHSLAVKYKLGGIHIARTDRKKPIANFIKLWLFKCLHKNLKITTSYHSLQSLLSDKKLYNYVFLSPIFDSISKKNYAPAFNERQLIFANQKSVNNIFALGGVDERHIVKAKNLGFKGVVLYGTIWNEGHNKLETFLKIKAAIQKAKNLPIEKLS